MRERGILTVVWVFSSISCIALVELYIDTRNSDGISILLPQDRLDAMKPIVTIYAGYVSGILAFWFLRPFSVPASDKASKVRFWVALGCSVLFNIVIIYLVARGHLALESNVIEDISSAEKMAGVLSFLVAPANFYYFGAKTITSK